MSYIPAIMVGRQQETFILAWNSHLPNIFPSYKTIFSWILYARNVQ
jgi:hypothetical protein